MKQSVNNAGINKLAKTIQRRVEDNLKGISALTLDFGEIKSDYSLLTNTYPIPIPKSDYLVLRQLTLGEEGSLLTTAGTGNDNHSHNVLIPANMRWLKPGDRVLAAWVQNDVVVIDIIKQASEIGG